jgi:hypothetical protein
VDPFFKTAFQHVLDSLSVIRSLQEAYNRHTIDNLKKSKGEGKVKGEGRFNKANGQNGLTKEYNIWGEGWGR